MPKSARVGKVAMCYFRSKINSKPIFMLAQFKLFDSKDNLIHTGGQNLKNYDLWKETEIPANETMVGIRCAGFKDTRAILGMGVVTISDYRGKVKVPQKPNTLAKTCCIRNSKLKTEKVYQLS